MSTVAAPRASDGFDFDWVIVGSGFGGSVAALRLAQKGYSVAVVEAGKRWATADFPCTNWDARRYLWMPQLGCHGLQRMDLLRGLLVVSGVGVGGRMPAYIPAANEFARRMAGHMNGIPLSSLSEVLLGAPATAHILGGCVIAERPEEGAVDLDQRVFGYENLLVCDGSVIPTNLGVNPALSILVFAERAMAAVPPKGGDPGAIQWLAVDREWQVEDLLLRDSRG